jgi:hypothetical protein
MELRRDFTSSKQIFWKKVPLILLLRAVNVFFILHLPSIMMLRTHRYSPFYSSLNIKLHGLELAFIDEIIIFEVLCTPFF